MPRKSESTLNVPNKCRCGKVHDMDASIKEFEVAIQHACYHDGGIIPWCSPGTLGFCAQCGMHFHPLGMGDYSSNYYPCPVCAFPCSEPCENYNICPCCGTEFGNHDAERTHAELRLNWLSVEPRPVFWKKDEEPKHWNPFLQLAMRYRNEGAKAVKHVSAEEMARLFKEHDMENKLKECEVESFDFPGPGEKPTK